MTDAVEAEIRTLEGTASFFDVSLPTVREWVRRGCPVVTKGTNGRAYELDLLAVHAWRQGLEDAEAAERERIAERDAQLRLQLLGGDMLDRGEGAMTARQRAEWLAAEVNHVKLAKFRRELIDAQDMKLHLTKIGGRLRDRLLGLADGLGESCGLEEDQVVLLNDRIRDALEDLADELDSLGGADDAVDLAA